MNIVDSSGWLEYFADGSNADCFLEPLNNLEELIVPSITIYEVFKVILREKDESNALQGIALMKQGRIVDLSSEIAMVAATISLKHKIPMADSIIWATGLKYNAIVWTQDRDFVNMPGVNYFEKEAP